MSRPIWRTSGRGVYGLLVALLGLAAGTSGCGGDDGLPPNIPDPASLKTPAGALARYRSARDMFTGTLDLVIMAGGIMTDELAAAPAPYGADGTAYSTTDARSDFTNTTIDNPVVAKNWNRLHRLRGQAREARGFLAAYAPDASPSLQGELYALEGYADIYLADLFCSGIPLSTVNFDGTYTLAAGSTTAEVYQRAIGLLDSAATLADTNASLPLLAAVGKGRALLALGRYAEAAAAVANVPDEYAYSVSFNWPVGTGTTINVQTVLPDSAALWVYGLNYSVTRSAPGMGDREGINGLDFRSSADPRSSFTRSAQGDLSGQLNYFPAKYTIDAGQGPGVPRYPAPAPASYVVASGIEARLIEAEAALQGGGDWLGKLNHLRQTMWTTIVADTVSDPWVPGPLTDLTDPGVDSARVTLLFRERAMWLFLTGHRQGDLRRLIRQYPGPTHTVNTVYPAGPYGGGTSILTYGTTAVMPVPKQAEQDLNAQYTGCVDLNP